MVVIDLCISPRSSPNLSPQSSPQSSSRSSPESTVQLLHLPRQTGLNAQARSTNVTNGVFLSAIVATPIDLAHYWAGRDRQHYRSIPVQMLSARGVCALESSSFTNEKGSMALGVNISKDIPQCYPPSAPQTQGLLLQRIILPLAPDQHRDCFYLYLFVIASLPFNWVPYTSYFSCQPASIVLATCHAQILRSDNFSLWMTMTIELITQPLAHSHVTKRLIWLECRESLHDYQRSISNKLYTRNQPENVV